MQNNQTGNVTEIEANPRWVKVMADYSSCGLWDSNGVHSDDADLPVSESLKARLRKWCDWYELNDDYLPEPTTQFDYEAFSAEGLLIAKAIKAQLPDWTVVYFDENRLHQALHGKLVQPRGTYDYEVMQ
jgi:hypothetical protein